MWCLLCFLFSISLLSTISSVIALANATNAMSKPIDMNGMDLVITPPSSSSSL
ncbi:MAG TPA: hypothetical protein VE573_05975 [Nitrososphaeraceae archaeon]|nr:hypothetical protein [Nitrososphaeraceae archaeon]